jgi:hypothetical protein
MEALATEMVTNAGLACGLDRFEVETTVRGAMRKGKEKPWGPTK